MTIADLLSASPGLFITIVFLFALLVGSFLNVVIYRLPVMMENEWADQCCELNGETPPDREPFNLVGPRSRCQHCGHAITAAQNIPVVSYIALGGKCAGCNARISLRYPCVELLTAVAAAIVAWRFGFGWEALAGIVLTFGLVALSGIDFDTQLLPDSIVYPLLWIGLLMSLAYPLIGAETLFISPSEAIIGAVVGYSILASVAGLFKLVTGKIGMGNGDFKLLAVFGAWLGVMQLPLIILLSAGVGSVVGISMIVFAGRDKQIPIPFGPYLAAAGWITMLAGESLMSRYLTWFQ